jgi:acyl dehydratase
MSAPGNALQIAESSVGTEVGVSDWVTIDQAMIDQFAKVTQDEQWIHTDPERAAAESPFGGTIAHGFLTLSLLSNMGFECCPKLPCQTMGVNYGINKLRFLSPVHVNVKVRARFLLISAKAAKDGNVLREYKVTLEIEKQDTPALVAEWLELVVIDSA